jgi:hypothetical protein
MGAAVGYSFPSDLQNFLLIGDGGDRHLPFYTSVDNLVYARRIAMTWLISGWGTRVIDLKLTQGGWAFDAPETILTFRAGNLQQVMDEVPGITKYCMKSEPVYPPDFMTDAAFAVWLIDFSNGVPTFPAIALPGPKIQKMDLPEPTLAVEEHKPPTVGVQHIQGMGGTFCGCKGHSEPDWPFMTPLKRDLTYCPQCIQIKTQYHSDCLRGYYRQKHHHEMMNPGSTYAPPMPSVWEEDSPSVPEVL